MKRYITNADDVAFEVRDMLYTISRLEGCTFWATRAAMVGYLAAVHYASVDEVEGSIVVIIDGVDHTTEGRNFPIECDVRDYIKNYEYG